MVCGKDVGPEVDCLRVVCGKDVVSRVVFGKDVVARVVGARVV